MINNLFWIWHNIQPLFFYLIWAHSQKDVHINAYKHVVLPRSKKCTWKQSNKASPNDSIVLYKYIVSIHTTAFGVRLIAP